MGRAAGGMRMGMGMGSSHSHSHSHFGLGPVVFVNQLLDATAVLGSVDAGVFDRATEPNIVAEIIRTVGVGQKIVYVDLANLVLTGCIATVVRFVAFRHWQAPR